MKKILTLIILFNIFLCTNLFAAKNLYISYKKVPSQVYKNQRFEVIIKALVTTKNFDYLTTSFSNSRNINVINPESKWEKTSNDVYENRYYFKAKDGNFRIPDFNVKLVNGNTTIDVSTLGATSISYSDIAKGDERFSNIIADELVLKAYKTKQYNNKEALTIIDIDAVNSNLEDFKIEGIEEQSISSLKDNHPNQNLIYYFVTPVHNKKIIFTYYNTSLKSFKEITVPLILQNELVSTQTDLNPNDSSFEKYKKVAAVIAFFLFAGIFLWKRKKIYLIIAIVLLIISVLYLIPNSRGLVKKDSYIYILPTKNSTIFFKLDKNQKVEILQKKNGFIKVLGIDNKFIGWVKEENFGKN